MFKGDWAVNIKQIALLLHYGNRNSFKILIKSSTFTIDPEYDLRHVCAHTIIGKNVKYTMSSPNKERAKKIFSLIILYLWIKKIARGILWVAWVASFSYSQLIIQRVKDITAQSFDRFRMTMATFDSFRVFAVCFWRSLRTSSSVNVGTIKLHWFSRDE